MKTLIIGGTGTVGSLVVKELVARQADLRVLARESSNTAGLPAEVEIARGDLLDPPSVRRALEGVDRVYLLNAVVPDELTQALVVFNEARRSQVKQFVYHSVFQSERFPGVPHFASKATVEHAIRMSGLPYTILKPNYFFQNDLGLKQLLTEYGVYGMPLGAEGISAVDVRDIAELTATVLTEEGHLYQTYNLNGPEVLSGPQAAAIWSQALGRSVAYPAPDLDEWEAQMREMTGSGWMAFDLRQMFQGYQEKGFVAEPDDALTFERVVGHAPRRYADFAAETAAQWKS